MHGDAPKGKSSPPISLYAELYFRPVVCVLKVVLPTAGLLRSGRLARLLRGPRLLRATSARGQ